MANRARHPKSRPLPEPVDRPALFSATCGEIVQTVILIELRAGKTPGQAALAAAREMIRHAQSLAEIERAFRETSAPADGDPRFTETR